MKKRPYRPCLRRQVTAKNMHYTYLLKSEKKDWVYVGPTSNLKKRLIQHNLGQVKSTKAYMPLKLVYYEAYLTIDIARAREREIKDSRQEKESLISKLALSSNG